MSLTSFIKMPEVKAKLKPLRPALPRRISVPLKVEPRTKHHTVVGTAFDYLLRFELQRRAPHASASTLVAESAPNVIWKQTGKRSSWMDLPGAAIGDLPGAEKAAKEMAARVRTAIPNPQSVLP